MNIQEFKETYCDNCGFSPCKGPHTEHFIDCRFKNKITIYENTCCTSVDKDNDYYLCHTKNGNTIKAK